MKFLKLSTLIPLFLLFFGMQMLQAQTTCGAVSGELSGTWMTLMVGDTSGMPVFTTNPSGLTHTEFIVTNPDVIAPDSLGPVMIGVDQDGRVTGNTYGLSTCEAFCITPFSYNLQEIKILVDAVLNNQFQPGIPCCFAVSALVPGFCDSLMANGIVDSSSVTGLTDLNVIISVLSGGTDISFISFVQTLDVLNSSLGSFGNCAGGLTQFCYATDTSGAGSDCYRLTNTAIPATAVTASPASATITTMGGTAQFSGIIAPGTSTDSIVWTIIGGSAATIDPSTGLATGQGGVDTLWVIAMAPNSCVSDTVLLYVNIPTGLEKVPTAAEFDLKILSNPFQNTLRFRILTENGVGMNTYSYALYDVNGRSILQNNAKNSIQSIEIDTDMLPAGVYHLQVYSGNRQVGKTVVKY